VKVPIKIEYFENTGGASAKLEWSGPNQTREVIPQSQLFPKASTTSIINDSQVPEMIGNLIVGESEGTDVLVFPNPADETVTLQLNKLTNSAVRLQMFNERGSVVHQESFINKAEYQLSLKTYSSGVYFIVLEDEAKEVGKSVKKLIIVH